MFEIVAKNINEAHSFYFALPLYYYVFAYGH